MLQISEFEPAWWLRNAHVQTMWPTLMRRFASPTVLLPQRVELPDGDFIDLAWDKANAHEAEKPLVLILHGLAGSLKSPYAQGLMHAVSAAGWRPVFMYFRGSSGVPNRLARSYHSGDTGDVAYVVSQLQQQHPGVPIMAIGISLGGNVLLKWLGETAGHNPLTAAVAVSVPFELHEATRTLNQGFSKIYQWRLLGHLRHDLQLKFKNPTLEFPFNLKQIRRAKNFYAFDDLVTAPLHNFKDANEYYQQSSSRQYLPSITKPTLIIHAVDDPFMPASVIPTSAELSASTVMELSDHGGHVGFIAGSKFGNPEYWLEQRITRYFSSLL